MFEGIRDSLRRDKLLLKVLTGKITRTEYTLEAYPHHTRLFTQPLRNEYEDYPEIIKMIEKFEHEYPMTSVKEAKEYDRLVSEIEKKVIDIHK